MRFFYGRRSGSFLVVQSHTTLHIPKAMRLNIRPSTTPSPQTANWGLNNQALTLIHRLRSVRIASPPFSPLWPVLFGGTHSKSLANSLIPHDFFVKNDKSLSGIHAPERPSSGSLPVGLHNNGLPHDDLNFYNFVYHALFSKKSKEPCSA